MTSSIPFYVTYHSSKALDHLRHALDSLHPSGAASGTYCKKFEGHIKQLTGSPHVLATDSCTSALELAMLALDVKPGDEVITQSFAFVAAPASIALRGAKVVYCDIEPATLQIDLDHLASLITPRTVGIMIIHYNGYSCDMDRLLSIAAKHSLWLVEDAAQALGSRFKGKSLGTFGAIGAFSFHETKNISAGEAGALLVKDDKLAARLEIMREKGTNRSAFFRKEVDKYTWHDLGGSHIPSELNLALGCANLEDFATIQARRKTVDARYRGALRNVPGIRLIDPPSLLEPNYHMFLFLVEGAPRNAFRAKLEEKGVGSSPHFVPLHKSDCSVRLYNSAKLHLPVTERVCDQLLRLPLYPQLTDAQIERIINAVQETGDELRA